MTSRAEAIDLFYAHLEKLADRIGGLKHLTDPGLSRRCPTAGLYFFFEAGEVRPNGRPRVVRIGTHALTPTSKTTLWGRLRQHMGHTGGSNPGGGNHRGSIFRRHVGTALLNRRGDTDLLGSWLAHHPLPEHVDSERALEVEVSSVIRVMPFLWLNVPTRPDQSSDRAGLERDLIALLSTLAGNDERASTTWLGHHAAAHKVRESSLWNVNHVDDTFDPRTLHLLPSYVRATTLVDAPFGRRRLQPPVPYVSICRRAALDLQRSLDAMMSSIICASLSSSDRSHSSDTEGCVRGLCHRPHLIGDRHEEGEPMDPVEHSRMRPGQLAAIVGAAVLVLAALMPWATVRSGFGQVNLSGTDGDGLITLIIGALVAVAAWLRMDRIRWRVAMIILCVLAAIIAGYDIANVGSLPGNEFADASVGTGLYLTFLAAVATGVAVLMEHDNAKNKPDTIQE